MTEHNVPLAAYLAGDLDAEQTDDVDEHLLACEVCWQEVRLAQLGRTAAQSAVEQAPDQLRTRLAANLADACGPHDSGPPWTPGMAPPAAGPRRWAVLALVAATCVAVGFGSGALTDRALRTPTASNSVEQSPSSPAERPPTTPVAESALDAALSAYSDDVLPGTAVPAEPAPDLIDLDLHLMGAGAGTLAGQPVTVYCYADIAGQKVFVYLSPGQFDAFDLPAGESTGSRNIEGLTVFTDTAHPMLVLGTDPALVIRVGTALA